MTEIRKQKYDDDRFLWSPEVVANYANSLHYGPGLDCLKTLSQRLEKKITILDAGAASGAFHAIMQKAEILHEYTACDINFTLLSKGRSYFRLAKAVQCDLTHLPFGTALFDAAVCYGTIFNIEKWGTALGELMRVSRYATIVNFLAPPLGSNSMRLRGILQGQYVWLPNQDELEVTLREHGLPAPNLLLSWQVPLNKNSDYPTFRGLDYRLELTAIWYHEQF